MQKVSNYYIMVGNYFDSGLDWSRVDPGSIPNELVMEHPLVQELTDTLEMKVDAKVPIPFVIKNRKLMSEGKWNDFYYPASAIKKAYNNTDWSDKRVVALYLNHSDSDVASWVGEIKNHKQVGSDLYGDLYIYDPNLAIKLAYGKPKFGISPKVRGDAQDKTIKDFVYENFSIVVNPAVKTTYLNRDNKKLYGGIYINQEEPTMPEEEEKKEEPKQEQPKEAEQKPEQAEEPAKEEKPAEEQKAEETTETMAKKKKEYPYPEKMKKKDKYPYPEADIKAKMSEYTDYIKKYIKENPKADFADAAEAWKKKKKLNEMSEDDLIKALEEALVNLKKKKYPEPEEGGKKLSEVVQTMSEKIKKLEDKLAEPDRAVIKAELSEKGPKNWDESFLTYLQGRCIK